MKRLQELDALRGLAALTVLLTHFHDMWYDDRFSHLSQTRWTHLHTLLVPLYAGHQAVMLFFLLSGFVLAIPFEGGKPQSYPTFLIRRVTRIYLPYLAAVAFATAGCLVWHGDLHHGPWAAPTWAHLPSPALLLQHAAFLGAFDVRLLDPPIWSLVHEMRISLVFPLLWLATRKLPTQVALLVPVACSLCAEGMMRGSDPASLNSFPLTLHYAGFFVIGILLARDYRHLLPRAGRPTAALAAASTIVYFYGPVLVEKLVGSRLNESSELMLAEYATLFGAAGILLAALAAPRPLQTRIPLFAGRISYSLYLVHLPVLMAITFAAGPLSRWLQLPLYIALSVGFATVFCLFVEEPCTRLGRSLTTRIKIGVPQAALERETGIEPATFSLGS